MTWTPVCTRRYHVSTDMDLLVQASDRGAHVSCPCPPRRCPLRTFNMVDEPQVDVRPCSDQGETHGWESFWGSGCWVTAKLIMYHACRRIGR